MASQYHVLSILNGIQTVSCMSRSRFHYRTLKVQNFQLPSSLSTKPRRLWLIQHVMHWAYSLSVNYNFLFWCYFVFSAGVTGLVRDGLEGSFASLEMRICFVGLANVPNSERRENVSSFNNYFLSIEFRVIFYFDKINSWT